MEGFNDAVVLATVAIAGAMLYLWRREILEGIEAFKDNFPRSRPPTAMHPSPAGDDSLLRAKSAKPK